MEEKTKQLRSRFGETLVKQEVINPDQLKTAIEEQKRTGKRRGEPQLRLGYISQYENIAFLSKQYWLRAIKLDDFEVMPEVLKFIPRESAIRHCLIPINRSAAKTVRADGFIAKSGFGIHLLPLIYWFFS